MPESGSARPHESPLFLLGIEVGPRLSTLLRRLDAQTLAPTSVRVVIVDCGGHPDDIAAAKAWVAGRTERAELVSATSSLAGRNVVLDRATELAPTGWVSFPESPDEIGNTYLEDISVAIDREPRATAVVSRQWRWVPDTGERSPFPLLDDVFREGESVAVSLCSQPEDSPTTARTTFVRMDRVIEHHVRFDERLAAGFAEIDFYLRLLASDPDPRCVFVDTRYDFRVRDDDGAGGRASFTRSERFTDVLRDGHLRLLRSFGGPASAPAFVQHSILLDLGWYFRADETLSGQMNAEMHRVQDEFHELVAQVLALIDPEVLDSVELRRMPLDRYIVLRHGYPEHDWHEEPVNLAGRDRRRGLTLLSYRYTGKRPVEELRVGGTDAQPRFAKSRTIVYAGKVLAYERLLWVSSAGDIRLALNGQPAAMARARAPRPRTTWSPRAVADAFGSRARHEASWASSPRSLARRALSVAVWRSWLVRMLAQSAPVRRRYGGSWVLMDRVESGHDNAEHLFAHLQASEPSIRSWFAVERNSKDWKRLERQGFRNLLAYGSLRWMLVCLNATHVVSSQAGPYVDDPALLRPIRRPSWRFIFLQHGVIATDLHRWLNRRRFDLFVTTTQDEYAAIAGTESLYRYTPNEVVLTGLPRHDRLVRLDQQLPRRRRNRILVVPSWREYLFATTGADARGQRALREDFAQTLYARSWFGLLRSERLKELADAHRASIAFMPHPNVQAYLHEFSLPDYVETLTYADNDIQQVLTSARVVITDFSSVVFDAAYIGRPIVYYQFDQAEAFGGTHTVRQGYFSYEEDGFGPVAYEQEEVIDALAEIADAGFEAAPEHAARRDATFPSRDDRSSARVVRAIRDLDRRIDPEEAIINVPLPVAPSQRPTPRADRTPRSS